MNRTYIDKVHLWGKIWSFGALLVLLSVPFGVSAYFNVWPQASLIFKALASVAIIYWPTAVIEIFTYVPMLGAGGTYLSFVTGNISNLKLPCGLNAMENAKVRANSEEGETISTIAIGVSSITTTLVIAIGVLFFAPVLPKLTDPSSVLSPAFTHVLPALFGALGASYFSKHWKIAVLPILLGCITLIIVPTLAVGTLLVVTIVASVGGALLLYKLKWIK